MVNTNDSGNGSDIKILVVDDREDNLFSIETLLEKDDYTVVKANSGRAALKILLKEHDFSLILMDVQMPDLNGFETATIIYERDKLKQIPIIFITAHNQEEGNIFKGYKMGGVDYIYKPINPELLKAKVGVFVELYRKNHQLAAHEKQLLAANKSLQKEIEDRKASEENVKLLNKQLIDNNTHLTAVNEELDRFAYVASHDLQEPLRKIMIFSDKILIDQKNEKEVEKYLKKIVGSSQRMQSLINDLLQFSRQDIDPDDFVNTDLNVLVKEAMLELEIEIEKNKAQINVAGLPVIFAIPGLMRQLFFNLINNAIKFRQKDTPPEINIISKKINNFKNNLNYYRISISDNGIGFDPAYSDDIFVIFKRLHSYHEFQGSGVGLSICKKIVDKHNGFIKASSKVNEGSTFVIELPEKQPASL
ncbi:MAG TPA: response regulator [Chitinophagaceae bacterium]|nr:response regulator [Chitinophagaceae bacterium]